MASLVRDEGVAGSNPATPTTLPADHSPPDDKSAECIAAGTTLTFRFPKRYVWEPQPDITTHELAVAVGVLFAFQADMGWAETYLTAQPENVRRHFREVGG